MRLPKGEGNMPGKLKLVSLLGAVLLIGGAMIGPVMSKTERPKYQVVASSDSIEVRDYAPMLIAQVEVDGERQQAINEGFRLLADFIFGNNRAQEAIAMTSPVQQSGQEVGQKIDMTAPVSQQNSQGSWQISFVMPSQFSLETLPIPNNDRVKIIEIPAKRFAAIRFSGQDSNDNIAAHEAQLRAFIDSKDLVTNGPVKYAFYDPPWTLPMMRRNEVMVEVDINDASF